MISAGTFTSISNIGVRYLLCPTVGSHTQKLRSMNCPIRPNICMVCARGAYEVHERPYLDGRVNTDPVFDGGALYTEQKRKQ